ncbi:MAG: GNAT family N-acetyltransferase [Gaiellaceae bacterium]|jgi:ribosomal protein S18 acetylase RimI-like enzyme
MNSPGGELERIVGFNRYLEERCSERIFSSRLATALLCESLPLVYDRNYLRVEDGEASAGELASLADRVLGSAGLGHRRIYADSPEIAERLEPQFKSLGWKTQPLLVMTHNGRVEEETLPLVAEVEIDEMLPFWEEENRVFHPDDQELVRQLTEQNLLIAGRIDCRYFARRLDGKVVSACQLFSRGATAQAESVGTLPDYRNRGLASSVIRRASAEAFSSGHDLVWLLAEENDWPKALYAKLGFNPAGRFCAFKR